MEYTMHIFPIDKLQFDWTIVCFAAEESLTLDLVALESVAWQMRAALQHMFSCIHVDIMKSACVRIFDSSLPS